SRWRSTSGPRASSWRARTYRSDDSSGSPRARRRQRERRARVLLEGRTVVVGLTGGIACYKACEVVRLLVGAGARVPVIMSAGAQQVVTPLTLQTLSGQPVATDTFSLTQESEIGHIRLADQADAIVIAPATANVLGKLANGIADDLLTTVLLAARAP